MGTATVEYGVFVWREDARYCWEDAVRIFAREGDAQRRADALNGSGGTSVPRGWVVRKVVR